MNASRELSRDKDTEDREVIKLKIIEHTQLNEIHTEHLCVISETVLLGYA